MDLYLNWHRKFQKVSFYQVFPVPLKVKVPTVPLLKAPINVNFNQTIASACIIKSAEWGAETDFGLKQPNWQLATILFWHFFWHYFKKMPICNAPIVDLVLGLQLSDTKTNFSVLIYKQLMYKMQQIR